MAIIKEYTEGNCKIYIDDLSCTRDKNDIHKILDLLSEEYSRYFSENPNLLKG